MDIITVIFLILMIGKIGADAEVTIEKLDARLKKIEEKEDKENEGNYQRHQ